MRAWIAEEPGALERLIVALRQNLLPRARIILRDPQGAEDVFIEAVIDLLPRLRDVEPEAALAYARRAVRSSAIDRLRSRQLRDARKAQRGAESMRRADPLRSTEPVERVGPGATNPERRALRVEARERILGAIEDLPEPERGIVRGHLVDGLTLDECAAALDLSRSTVKRGLQRGRARLARALRDLKVRGVHGL